MVRRASVQFKNGKQYVIPLYRAKPITVLHGADGSHFLLAEGADCTDCDENIGLRFYELGNPELKHADRRHRYLGRLFDYMDPSRLLEQSRTFYGRCINDKSDSVLWFIKYLVEDSQWHSVCGVVNISKEGDNLQKLTPVETSLQAVLKAVKRGNCIELAGVDGITEP